jgi:cell filamentation protein
MNKYDTSGNIEDQYEPGSNGMVLKNKLGIADFKTMDALESNLLKKTEDMLIEELTDDFQFTGQFIYEMHKLWLGDIYEWAGRPRTVQMSKGTITFCSPQFISQEMQRFEGNELAEWTPCTFEKIPEIAEAIAVVHGEFEIIHPFREGNGRLGRLLASLMANQAGFAVPNLDEYIKNNLQKYFDALSSCWNKDYKLLTAMFADILDGKIQ